jgi:hypothetical protein
MIINLIEKPPYFKVVTENFTEIRRFVKRKDLNDYLRRENITINQILKE